MASRIVRLSKSLGPSLLGLAVVAVISGCSGKGAQGECPALGSCGGNPSGNWKIANVCQYSAVRPAQPSDIGEFLSGAAPMLAPPQPNPALPVQTTSGDWCSSLVYPADGKITNAALWHDAPLLVDGQLSFMEADHSYTTALTFSTPVSPTDPLAPGDRNATHFAPGCLVANGGKSMADPSGKTPPTCTELATGLADYYMAQGMLMSFNDIQCANAADKGCDCSYIYKLVVADAGNWSVSGSSLFETSSLITYNGQEAKTQAPTQTLEASFCSQPSAQLQLTGARGSSLSGLPGLRSLTLVPQ